MSRFAKFCFCPILCLGTAFSQTVSLSGTVRNAVTTGVISGSSVVLIGRSLSTTTNGNGIYQLTSPTAIHSSSSTGSAPELRSNLLAFRIAESQHVLIAAFDIRGGKISDVFDGVLKPGQYEFPLELRSKAQIQFLRFESRDQTALFRVVAGEILADPETRRENPLPKMTSAAVDTLVVSASGYVTARVPLNAYTGVADVNLVPTSVTLYATSDNLMMSSSVNSATGNTAYANSDIGVGCNWALMWNPIAMLWYQDFVCGNSLIYFDINTLITGRNIASATLTLNAYSLPASYTTFYYLRAVYDLWYNTVTWNTQPRYVVGTNITVPQPTVATLNIDVTNIVRSWSVGSYPNYGFFLDVSTVVFPMATRYEMTPMCSLEAYNNCGGANFRPRITLNFQ